MIDLSIASTNSESSPCPRLLLIDAKINDSALPLATELKKYFQLETGSLHRIEDVIYETRPHAILFEFDYPEREGLGVVRDVKEGWPSIPLIMTTVQHSEHLAVWALRARLWDYYVQPLLTADLQRMQSELKMLSGLPDQRAGARASIDRQPKLPVDARFLPSAPSTKLALVANYVKKHVEEGISNDAVAQLSGMNFCNFSRRFRQHYGISFQAYVTQQRMDEAARLLQNPHISIADVAFNVGYRDTSYFSRMFRKHYHITPSAYRDSTVDTSGLVTPLAQSTKI